MRYGKIKYFDIANGSGVRTSLFVSGCYRHCPGCFSPETWDFRYGEEFTADTEREILKSLEPNHISGLSILGGEPLANRFELIPFMRTVKEQFPEKPLWLFTGYGWNELVTMANADESVAEILALTDVLKAGMYLENQYEAGLQFRGSRNQELIDLKKTRQTGVKTLWQSEFA